MIRIISIPTLSDFDRVRSQFQKLKTEGYRLTLDMANVIETRTRELFNNHIKFIHSLPPNLVFSVNIWLHRVVVLVTSNLHDYDRINT